MATFRDLLTEAKARIREVDTHGAEEILAQPGAILLDVREPDEFEQGAIPGAVHIPRGQLESNVENRIPDKSDTDRGPCAPAGCARPSRPRRSSSSGYTDVVSMDGGFNKWKDEGRDWRLPAPSIPEQRNRYQRHLLLPEVGEEGQLKLLDAKVLLPRCRWARFARRAVPGRGRVWARSASSTWTSSTSRTSSARSCTTSIASAIARSTRRRRRSPR